MGPTTLALLSYATPYALALLHSAFIHWQSSKAHPAAVSAAANAAANAATAGATAAIAAMQAGASGKDAAKAAGIAALGTAVDGKPIQGPPAP